MMDIPTLFCTKLIYELPSPIVSMKTVNDMLVVKCKDGITHLISKKAVEAFEKRNDHD